MSDVAAANIFNDLFRRLRLSLAWVAAQFWATLLIILAGIAWTRCQTMRCATASNGTVS